MTDLLVQRLKAAKRELTALKTAHRRGLGLLKIYHYEYDIPPPSGDVSFYRLTVNVSFDISPFPFVQRFMVVDDIYYNPFSADEEIIYAANGWTSQIKAVYLLASHYTMALNSTSPIISMSYSWGNI